MNKKKQIKKDDPMRELHFRLTQRKYDELKDILDNSNITTMSELIRHILENRKIRQEYYDKSLDLVMPDLAQNRRELRAIGMNMSQVMKRFSEQQWPEEMLKDSVEAANLCQAAGLNIESFLNLLTKIIQKWLPE